jgi:hypothetical protein
MTNIIEEGVHANRFFNVRIGRGFSITPLSPTHFAKMVVLSLTIRWLIDGFKDLKLPGFQSQCWSM